MGLFSNMVRCVLFLLVTVSVIGHLVSCDGGKDRIIPAADFFSEPEKTNFRISPNGKYLAYLGGYAGQKNIFIIHLDEGSRHQRITSETELGIQSCFWANDDELIFTKDKRNDSLQVFAVNRSTLGVRHLMLPSTVKLRWISPSKVINNGFLISLNERDSSVFDVYRLRTDACQKELVARNPGNIIRWYADLDGELRLALASDSLKETMLYRDSEKKPFRAVVSNSFRNSIMPLGFSAENRNHIFALSNINRDKLALVEIDMNTGREVRLIYSHPDVDVSHGGYSTDRGEMSYASYFTWKKQRHFLNEETKNVYHKIEQKLQGYELMVLDRDTARRRFIVRSYTDKDPGAVYYYDMAKDELTKLVANNPALNDCELAEMKPVTYYARDGRQIHGYLTMPPKIRGRKPPVIVYPHSGPSNRDRWGFDPEVQFFANRGYAVFQVNYRGSTGYGKEFWSAGSKEWGGKIQDDITDGVRWLIQERKVDSARIGIYGAGFGGYSALHGACFHSDLYACAASYSGFINLFTYLKEVPPYFKPYLQMYYETVGNPETEPELIKSMSPVFHSDQINIPVFIAQGGRDSWSTVNETNQFVQKLKKRKVPITYLLREEEGRYFRNEENRILFYNELGEFFDKYLK
ncbi:Dipeptidyl aminopeptidase/acylaminoacyl peptidase [Parapedobacter indicus]|uniref:Dipeptidyl aminopeptidase/acylaminoacyl peptidase n=1 Tax=Parapedobacter indicus TaxID=1477437 RepID=A0A1I3SHA0_9SPHI|nr:dipeptidyl aminopeptidase/acylaminoacyl peptidase [Parapedobacter indicus]SFJ58078.1 Dipeptidyl aminopeptidase/acylaminoacyl peptidase [Parapedobacter indicus]